MNKMNASIAHLPEKNQEDLKIIVATRLLKCGGNLHPQSDSP